MSSHEALTSSGTPCATPYQVPLPSGASRTPTLEPLGETRESFYESKLLLGLPWFCEAPPETVVGADGHTAIQWTFKCEPPCASIEPLTFRVGGTEQPSFEQLCEECETLLSAPELDLVCDCCTQEINGSPCKSCKYATGFHKCTHPDFRGRPQHRWRKGTLHAGTTDVQRLLFNLHRRMVPWENLVTVAEKYVAHEKISKEAMMRALDCIRAERGIETHLNDGVGDALEDSNAQAATSKLTVADMRKELNRRVELMKAGAPEAGVADQFRVYSHIINNIESKNFLRLMTQARCTFGCCTCFAVLPS